MIKTVSNDDYTNTSKMYDVLLNPFLNQIRYAFVNWVKIYKPEKVLDVGCGTGRQLALLPTNIDSRGIDLSDAMLAQADKQAHGKCQKADATNIPFENNSFDLIVSQFALHEKDSTTVQLELGEVKRLLKADGLFSVVDFDFPKDDSVLSKIFKWGIARIEQQAGDEHYANYKIWMKRGGLRSIFKQSGWELVEEQLFYKGNVRLTFWKIA